MNYGVECRNTALVQSRLGAHAKSLVTLILFGTQGQGARSGQAPNQDKTRAPTDQKRPGRHHLSTNQRGDEIEALWSVDQPRIIPSRVLNSGASVGSTPPVADSPAG